VMLRPLRFWKRLMLEMKNWRRRWNDTISPMEGLCVFWGARPDSLPYVLQERRVAVVIQRPTSWSGVGW